MADPTGTIATSSEASNRMSESISNLLANDADLQTQTTNHVYIRDDKYAWIPARVEKTDDDGTTAHVVIPEYKDERSIQSDGGRTAKRFRKETVNLKVKVLGLNSRVHAIQDLFQHIAAPPAATPAKASKRRKRNA